jgi:G:T-mismatch repair DNA endonuclease (very short patch repair protein)
MKHRDERGRFLKGHPVFQGWGFQKGHKINLFWTEEKIALLKKLYATKTNLELSKIFGVTPKAIADMGSALGLKKTPEVNARAHSRKLSQESRKKVLQGWKKWYQIHGGYWKGKKLSKSHRKNISKGVKGKKLGDLNPARRSEVRRKIATTLREGASSFHHLKNHPEWRKRSLEALIKKPTKPEKRLIDIIEKEALPYRYAGNGSVIIGTLNPDFIHTDSKKKLIEIFGRSFHDPDASFKDEIPWHQQYWGRRAYYAQFGYDCLILWDDELKDEERVAEKIKRFEEGSA